MAIYRDMLTTLSPYKLGENTRDQVNRMGLESDGCIEMWVGDPNPSANTFTGHFRLFQVHCRLIYEFLILNYRVVEDKAQVG